MMDPENIEVKKETVNERKRPKKENSKSQTTLKKTPKLEFRPCTISGCPATRPACEAVASEGCTGSGYSSRWYHLSVLEHYCNQCFEHFYRPQKRGSAVFSNWRAQCVGNCRREPNIKTFMAEEVIAYWLKCTKCSKWRKRETRVGENFYPKDIRAFKCESIEELSCDVPEDFIVKMILSNPNWVQEITYTPYLKCSPTAKFLGGFFPDGVGLSPMSPLEDHTDVPDFQQHMEPFYSPECFEKARCVCPDNMDTDELKMFSQFKKIQSVYLGIRNLILTLWNINNKEPLTVKKCAENLITRGLTRIVLIERHLPAILDFVTLRSLVNYGCLPIPSSPLFRTISLKKQSIVVVGSGISGLSAARMLKAAGFQVTVLEAKDRFGGRIEDDMSLGVAIGRGAQIITGCQNNPIVAMLQQLNYPVRLLGSKCDLLMSDGTKAPLEEDKHVEKNFDKILDSLQEVKDASYRNENDDVSLEDAINSRISEHETATGTSFTSTEKTLFQFHLGNLEFGYGTYLGKVSGFNWNQNEEMPQFSGKHAWVSCGYSKIIEFLAEGLDIHLSSPVKSVAYGEESVCLTTDGRREYNCDKTIITIPLAILQKKNLTFTPELPQWKSNAIGNLGAGLIEKVAMRFSTNFWHEKIGEADFFGCTSDSSDTRGMFSHFYDASNEDFHVLMTVVAGKAVEKLANLKQDEIVGKAMTLLRRLFHEKDVPDPISSVATSWGSDPHISMSYSYIPVYSNGQHYEAMAKCVAEKVYFAGEATNRQFPQTVTGAYLSGIREAKKIIEAAIES